MCSHLVGILPYPREPRCNGVTSCIRAQPSLLIVDDPWRARCQYFCLSFGEQFRPGLLRSAPWIGDRNKVSEIHVEGLFFLRRGEERRRGREAKKGERREQCTLSYLERRTILTFSSMPASAFVLLHIEVGIKSCRMNCYGLYRPSSWFSTAAQWHNSTPYSTGSLFMLVPWTNHVSPMS